MKLSKNLAMLCTVSGTFRGRVLQWSSLNAASTPQILRIWGDPSDWISSLSYNNTQPNMTIVPGNHQEQSYGVLAEHYEMGLMVWHSPASRAMYKAAVESDLLPQPAKFSAPCSSQVVVRLFMGTGGMLLPLTFMKYVLLC